ncbi:hypothetical protein QT327_10590 [Olivibacter sp. 47]|uniref:hypothetical protein n=1 Tax=Olivibacter sp. 47 TaxID=3056486 RepID=UPI0025A485C2|nr:hypothetical protein [Olivibacter sp. 47]MDM8174797.1 hypothetical protein [Olivibacter sp. 47]
MVTLYRNNALIETIPLTRDISFQHALMSEHKIVISNLVVPRILNVQIGDYLVYNGIKYTINTVPNYEKVEHTTNHAYNITFEHPIYTSYNKIFMIEGDSNAPFFGTPDDFVNLWLENMNSIDPTWTKGQVDVMDEIHLTISDSSCRVALTTFTEQQKMEFFFDGPEGKRINLVAKAGVDTDIVLQYGKGNGLYSLARSYVEDKNVVTRVYGIGGSRNLPTGYTKSRLQLDSPLEANIDLYGIIEGQYVNEDIYPTRTGTVTSVTPYDPETKFNMLVDADLPFNIKDQLAPGLTAKISFDNGELAGYEFEITEYDPVTKTITYLTNTDTSTGLSMPNSNFQAKAGDNYKLLDIVLPQSYVDEAISRLTTETQAFLDESKFPRVAYDLTIDVLHFKRNGYVLNPGDRIRIIDTDINVDMLIRVTSVNYPLAFYLDNSLWSGMQYSVELANDFIPYTTQERIQIEVRENKKAIKEQSKASKHTQAALDEIARAAAINQFARTYIGQLAILTGALVVGNPISGQTAFVSGLGEELTDLRFGAGGTIDDPESNKFRVNHGGQVWMTDAFIRGVIEALSGRIGNWIISDGGIINEDGSAYIIARENLGVDQEATAMIGANVLSAVTGLRAVGLFRNTEEAPLFTNYGLILEVNGGGDNIALDILSGQIASLNLRSRQLNSTSNLMRTDVWISSYNTSPITLTLPASPNNGKVLYIRQMNSFGITFNGNGINIHVAGDVGTTYTNANANIGDCHQFVYDGQFWCYNQIYREVPA